MAAVCHGPAGLLGAELDGRPLVSGRRVACFSNAEERAIGMTKIVPFLLADALAAQGAELRRGAGVHAARGVRRSAGHRAEPGLGPAGRRARRGLLARVAPPRGRTSRRKPDWVSELHDLTRPPGHHLDRGHRCAGLHRRAALAPVAADRRAACPGSAHRNPQPTSETIAQPRNEVAEEPVTIEVPGDRLDGRIVRPAGAGRFPAVVLVSGAGASTADHLLPLARELAAQGVVALTLQQAHQRLSPGLPARLRTAGRRRARRRQDAGRAGSTWILIGSGCGV